MTFEGTQAAINDVLRGATYLPPPFFNGNDTVTLVVSDNGNVGSERAGASTSSLAGRGERQCVQFVFPHQGTSSQSTQGNQQATFVLEFPASDNAGGQTAAMSLDVDRWEVAAQVQEIVGAYRDHRIDSTARETHHSITVVPSHHPDFYKWCFAFPASLGDLPQVSVVASPVGSVASAWTEITGALPGSNDLRDSSEISVVVVPVNNPPVWDVPVAVVALRSSEATSKATEDSMTIIQGLVLEDNDVSAAVAGLTSPLEHPYLEVDIRCAHGRISLTEIMPALVFSQPTSSVLGTGALATRSNVRDGQLPVEGRQSGTGLFGTHRGDGNWTRRLTMRGKLDDLNRAMAHLAYAPDRS
jgi:hypothetical protein